MGRSIKVQVYRFEVGTNGVTNFVTQSYPDILNTDTFAGVDPVNVQGGQDVSGLPYLYSKIRFKQPGINQEVFLMNSVLDILTQWNA